MNPTLYSALTLIIPLIIAIVFHEVAHGWVALMLGDPTAQERRRLTFNPLRHVDPIGTIVLPGILALIKAPIFGWAKPVPIDKSRLRNPRFGMMAVAIAGPASNLILAGVAAIALGLMARSLGGQAPAQAGLAAFVVANLFNFLLINIFLALFNLLPIPPFDGSHIVEGLLPPRAAEVYARLRQFGFLLIVLLLFVLPKLIPGFDLIGHYVQPPVEWLTNHYLALAAAVAGR